MTDAQCPDCGVYPAQGEPHLVNCAAVTRWTDDELHTRAQGCTELSCLYHGLINSERIARGIHPKQGGPPR